MLAPQEGFCLPEGHMASHRGISLSGMFPLREWFFEIQTAVPQRNPHEQELFSPAKGFFQDRPEFHRDRRQEQSFFLLQRGFFKADLSSIGTGGRSKIFSPAKGFFKADLRSIGTDGTSKAFFPYKGVFSRPPAFHRDRRHEQGFFPLQRGFFKTACVP